MSYVEYVAAAAKEKFIKWSVALVLTGALLACVLMVTSGFIKAIFSYRSKPEIQLVKPPSWENAPNHPHTPPWEFSHEKAPACKVCHCHKTSCHQECGEENMCNMRCEGLCKR